MLTDHITQILLGLLSLLGIFFASVWASRATTRADKIKAETSLVETTATTRIEQQRVDGEAYDRAREIDREVFDTLRREISRLNERVTEEITYRQRLERRVGQLESTLRENNIPVPVLVEKDMPPREDATP